MLILAACSDGSAGTDDPVAEPAGSVAAPSPAAPEEDESADPTPAETPAVAVADTGPAAKAGQGRFDVNGTTYALTVTECKFNGEGLAEGSFEVKATDADGHDFDMTQFYLNGDWSQTDIQLDLGPTMIYVIRSSASEGAVPATVDGTNVTWTESFRELDEAANSQVEIGTGTLNLTCE
jgi:hypothetical protein